MADLNLTYDEARTIAKEVIETWRRLGETDGDIFDAVVEVMMNA
tara:strand:- start:513 stop:644 length:132 start_codon:yes stop_codon:yes gene_type:complete